MNTVFQVVYRYDVIAKTASFQEALACIKEKLDEHNVKYKQINRVKTKLTDVQGNVHNAWYVTYQYRTLYFETFLIIETEDNYVFHAKGIDY